MALNFGKLAVSTSSDSVIPPRDIFTALPKKHRKYQYPRDVQAEVWKDWHDRRTESDLVIKMNTGGGKTVVGLLILKSCLNEDVGPAVYVAPDPYLVGQVVDEANRLGLEVTEDPDSLRFLRGKAILVTSIFRLINGQSVFGVAERGVRIKIGSLLIDDAHACLATTEEQFTLKATGDVYKDLFTLFRETLFDQSPSIALEVEQGESFKEMRVPFWAWIDKNQKVSEILYSHHKDDDLKFTWPLLKEHLKLCRCVFGRGRVEITPLVSPISVIPSIPQAKRRIFMSATLTDDSVLVSHFDIAPEVAMKPISPSTADDIGDRMIFVPQELNPSISDEDFRSFASKLAEKRNVVVLVPSNRRAKFWEGVAALILNPKDLEDGVKKLREPEHVGLVVIVNRYDGIDLPGDACPILVLDGLPDFRGMNDKIEEGILQGSGTILAQRIQRVEQGMGRGVRSSDDYCVVFLMGRTLTNFLYEGRSMFTAATREQMKLSESLSEQLLGKPLAEIESAIEYSLSRDQEWVSAAKGILVGLKYENGNPADPQVVARRQAFNAVQVKDYEKAKRAVQVAVDASADDVTKGWNLALLAEVTHLIDAVEAQAILKSAVSKNPRVTRPMAGILYTKLIPSNISQSQQCAEFIKAKYPDGNRLILAVHALLDDLIFQPETSAAFEEAVKQLAFFIGFRGQRPELDFGKGPDNLWEIGGQRYLVIECKNGATTDTIVKHNCNQLNGSMVWFSEKYDPTSSATAVMIHPVSVFEFECSPHASTRIITREKLDELKVAIRTVFESIAQSQNRDPGSIAALLDHFHLTKDKLVAKYTVPFLVRQRA